MPGPLHSASLQLVINNLPESHFEEVEAKVFPGRSEETYKVCRVNTYTVNEPILNRLHSGALG